MSSARLAVLLLALSACDATEEGAAPPLDAGPMADAQVVDGAAADAAAAEDAAIDAGPAVPDAGAVEPDGGAACVTDEAQFGAAVVPVLAGTCVGCHAVGGPAEGTRHVLLPFSDAAAEAENHQRLAALIRDTDDMAELLLQKPTNQVAHGGGQLFGIDSAQYAALREFVARVQAPGGCADPAEPLPSCESIVEPGASPLRRITDSQYRNTVRDLFGVDLPAGLFPETSANGYFRTDPRNNPVSGTGVESIMLAAEAVAGALDLDAVRTCAPDEPLDACTRRAILDLGYRAYRRALTGAEAGVLLRYLDAGLEPDAALRTAVELMVQSPQFLYLDARPAAADAEIARLDDFAVATRLAFFLTDTTPDGPLLDAARAGALGSRAAVAEHARRLVADPRARRAVRHFHRDWIDVWRLRNATRDPGRYPDFSAATVDAMLTELDLFVTEVVWAGDGRFETLLFSDVTWVDTQLAAIYGLPDPGPGWHRVRLDARRPGVLTRSAFLAAHAYAASSSPVQRGAFVLRDMLCEDLEPPADVNMDLPEPSEEARTIRERLERHWTSGACRACHERIDPLGFAFEHFGALGEWRTEWADGTPVDAVGALADPAGEFDGAASMIGLVAQSPRLQTCYARRWLEYAIGRPTTAQDRCTIEQLSARFAASDGDIRALMVDVALTDPFLYRRVEAP